MHIPLLQGRVCCNYQVELFQSSVSSVSLIFFLPTPFFSYIERDFEVSGGDNEFISLRRNLLFASCVLNYCD